MNVKAHGDVKVPGDGNHNSVLFYAALPWCLSVDQVNNDLNREIRVGMARYMEPDKGLISWKGLVHTWQTGLRICIGYVCLQMALKYRKGIPGVTPTLLTIRKKMST